jgi:shikimate kinase
VEQDEGETEEENVKNFLRLQAAELGSQLRGTNLYFVGMMGTGKSTVARGLADVMGRYSFLDTDTIIEELLGAPVSQIFEEDGEEAFRSVEGQVLDQVHSYVKMCVATGGGIVCRQENWGKLQTGLVVWLDMDVEDIVHRLRADEAEVAKRPLLKGGDDAGAKLAAILEDRRSLYELADVHVRIDRDDDVDAAVVSTIEAIQTFIDNNPPKWRQWKEQAKASGMDWV